MARPRATPEQREQQRRRIRRAAAEVYREHGIGGFTVRAIAERAGISTGALYSYFENLHELLRSLWTEPVAAANERLEALAAAEPDPLRRIAAILEGYADFARREPEIYRSLLLFVRPSALPPPEVQPADAAPVHRLLREAIAEGQAAGVVREGDPSQLAQVLWAGVHGALGLPQNLEGFELDEPQRLAAAMIPALLRSIRP